MGRSITFAELKARTLRAADMQRQNTQGYAQLDVPDLVNEAVASLYDLIISSYEDYFINTANITVPPRTAPDVPLPSDFYKLRSITSGLTTDPNVMQPFSELERPSNIADTSCDGYQINGSSICVLTSADTVAVLRYVPQPPYLVADTDTISMAVVPGWESFIVYDAAAALVAKADRDTTQLAARRDRIAARIQTLAEGRDAGRPHQLTDVYAFDYSSGGW